MRRPLVVLGGMMYTMSAASLPTVLGFILWLLARAPWSTLPVVVILTAVTLVLSLARYGWEFGSVPSEKQQNMSDLN
jgi:hypothetical protein